MLKLLGRRHDSRQAINAVEAAQVAGFTNVNLDLMYGLPGQSMDQWQDTLQRVASLSPKHLSLYALTPEEGTPLHQWLKDGSVPNPDSDLAADMYQHARDHLAEAGFHHYEISNWSLPDCQAIHNLGYWRNLPYLGVGPGAHSRLGAYRFWDVSSPRSYLAKVKKWAASNPGAYQGLTEAALESASPVDGWEHISPEIDSSEMMILGLRLLDGMDLGEASARVGQDLEAIYGAQIDELTGLGLLERSNGLLRLTTETYLVANQVFTRFVG
jgi:oxygen-independent coproporphyrinogen-3 oxidase